jgi:hypothetical protein
MPLAVEQAIEETYTSLHNDNADIDTARLHPRRPTNGAAGSRR